MNNMLKLFLALLLVESSSSTFCVGIAPVYTPYLKSIQLFLKNNHQALLAKVDKDVLLVDIAESLDMTVFRLVALHSLKVEREIPLSGLLNSIGVDSFKNVQEFLVDFFVKGVIPDDIFNRCAINEKDYLEIKLTSENRQFDIYDESTEAINEGNYTRTTLNASFTNALIRRIQRTANYNFCNHPGIDTPDLYTKNLMDKLSEVPEGRETNENIVPEVQFLDKMLKLLEEDHKMIKEFFRTVLTKNFPNDNVLKADILNDAKNDNAELHLIHISLNNGDRHSIDGGVAILTFQYLGKEPKLVYKTGPVRPDFLVMGDTIFYQNMFNNFNNATPVKKLRNYGINNSFIEIIGKGINIESNPKIPTEIDDETARLYMPKPYLVLPIEYTGAIEEKGALPMKKIYGYIEFIESETIENFRYRSSKDTFNRATMTNPGKMMFHMAFIKMIKSKLLSTDLHDQNMIIDLVNSRVTAIDLEVAFDKHNSQINMIDDFQNVVDAVTNSYKADEIEICRKAYTDANDKLDTLIYRAGALINDWLNSKSLETMPLRHIPIGTNKLLSIIFNYSNYGYKISKRGIFVLNDDFKKKLQKLEFPSFYLRANEKEMYDVDGKEVKYDAFNVDKLLNDGFLHSVYKPQHLDFITNNRFDDPFIIAARENLFNFYQVYVSKLQKDYEARIKAAEESASNQAAIAQGASQEVEMKTVVGILNKDSRKKILKLLI